MNSPPTAWLALFALALPAAAQAPTPAPDTQDFSVVMLRLYDGGTLWGTIEGHDAEGLHFVRLDNGGRARLPWARLDPAQSEAMQEAFGYIDHSSEELVIEADRVVLDNGVEWIGIIVNRTEQELWLKTVSVPLVKVPKLRLRGATTTVQVPALDVYSGEELYRDELARLDPTSAVGQYELGRFCERILEFERAIEHYREAQKLDPELKRDELAARLERVAQKAASKAQIEYLREIEGLRGRGRFDEALAKATAFEELFPESALQSDASKKKAQVEKSRDAKLREQTLKLWHSWAGRLCERKARDPQTTLEAALGWLEESLHEEILAAVHGELARTVTQSVTPDQVQRYWAERGESARVHKASYGGGTWLLGPEAARAGMPEQAPDASKMSEKERERAKLEERIRRYVQNQSAVRKAKIEAEGESEQSLYWKERTALERAQWMLAYYAEKGGDMRLVRFLIENCDECNGTGIREMTSLNMLPPQSGQSQAIPIDKVPCPLCHNVGVVRRVAYR